ncbi:hypothetical protein BOX15_Mlig003033g1 [Macrostomum lignano]|uniref:DUF4806 domain-containing protein n=4 Tax=Macrostomum lignano TaxID=282301 RepID=A0A267F7M0_9PLAT|nr:hypothetical protein BOX15_Mlig003033g1 [Macrostomum lignano]
MAMRFVVIFSCDLEVVEVPFEQIRLQGRFATFDSHNDWIGFAQSDDHETERIRCSAIYGDAFYEATVILVSLDDGYDLTRVIQYCRRCRLEKDFRPKRIFLQVSPRVICPGVKKRLLLKPVQALQSDHGTMDSEADVGSGQPAASASHPHGASVVPKPSMEAAQLLPMQNRASPSAAAASPSDLHRSVRPTDTATATSTPGPQHDQSFTAAAAAAAITAASSSTQSRNRESVGLQLENQAARRLMMDLTAKFGDLASLKGISQLMLLVLRGQQLQEQRDATIQQQQREILAALNRQGNSTVGGTIIELPEAEWQPAASWAGYLKLASDKEAQKVLRTQLARCRGDSVASTIRRMLLKCITPEMMAQLNYCGRGLAERSGGAGTDDSLGFQTTLLPLLKRAVSTMYKDDKPHERPSERDVEKHVISALKHAGDNLRKKAKKRPSAPEQGSGKRHYPDSQDLSDESPSP